MCAGRARSRTGAFVQDARNRRPEEWGGGGRWAATHGRGAGAALPAAAIGSHHEHWRRMPRSLKSSRSVRRNRRPCHSNAGGPRCSISYLAGGGGARGRARITAGGRSAGGGGAPRRARAARVGAVGANEAAARGERARTERSAARRRASQRERRGCGSGEERRGRARHSAGTRAALFVRGKSGCDNRACGDDARSELTRRAAAG